MNPRPCYWQSVASFPGANTPATLVCSLNSPAEGLAGRSSSGTRTAQGRMGTPETPLLLSVCVCGMWAWGGGVNYPPSCFTPQSTLLTGVPARTAPPGLSKTPPSRGLVSFSLLVDPTHLLSWVGG